MEGTFLAVNKKYFGLGLKSIEILIIAQIEEFIRNKRDCYLTNEQIAEMFGESVSTIKRVMAKLEQLNILNRNTTFINGHGKSTRQRKMTINDQTLWKVPNDPNKNMVGSKTKNEELNSIKCKAHTEPIKNNLKNKEKNNLKKSSSRIISDLTYAEGSDIINALKKKVPYVEIQQKYNLEFDSVNKDFPKKWRSECIYREQEAERLRSKNEPRIRIDYSRLPQPKKEPELDIEAFLNEWQAEDTPDPPKEIDPSDPYHGYESLKLLAQLNAARETGELL